MTAPTLRTRKEYARRMNAALDRLDRNLDHDVSVAKLAAAARFSPFHFPRLDYNVSAGAKAFTFDLFIPVKAL
jgi:hypothetical protein